jgi:hypothetical protein
VGKTTHEKGKTTEWRVHPASEGPAVTLLLVAFMFLVVWFLQVSWGSWPISCGALIFLLSSLRKWFFPSSCVADSDKMTVRTWYGTSIFHWQKVKRVRLQGRGLSLSMDEGGSGSLLTGKGHAYILLPVSDTAREEIVGQLQGIIPIERG